MRYLFASWKHLIRAAESSRLRLALAAANGPSAVGTTLFAKSSSGGGDQKKVRVTRRRRTDSDDKPRQRAEAPKRRRTEQPRSAPPRGSGGSSAPPRRPASLPFPSGGKRPPSIVVVFLVLIAICVFVVLPMFNSAGDGAAVDQGGAAPVSDNSAFTDSTAADPTSRPVPAVQPTIDLSAAASGEGQTWLVMLYQDADDKILEQDIYVDLNEAERIGSTDRVHIVAQVDRFAAGFQGDGNWSSARRYYITRDNDLQRVQSQLLMDLGEVNMADGDTLVDFVTWAVDSYPADKYVLIMSDHGMGWPGGWSDPAPGAPGIRSIPLANRLGDELYLMELDQSLAEIRAAVDIDKFELIGMDACLMGHLEVFTALAPHARYAVASQEVEPALGWAYTGFLQELALNPEMNGGELGRHIVDSYIQEDQRIVDEEARAEFLRGGSPLQGLFGSFNTVSAGQLARQMEQNITLTVADLSALPLLTNSLNELAFNLQGTNQQQIAQARSYAQSFTSVFGSDVPASYIDLGSFVQLVQRDTKSSSVSAAVNQVMAAIDQVVVAERHGPNKAGATGISIYFPNSQLYQSPLAGPESYTAIARRFADESLWDDFLAYHYSGRSFESVPAAAVAAPAAAVRAPGQGAITVSPITLSDDRAAPGRPVLLTTEITGDNVGYVLLFVGFYDTGSNSIFVADSDYLESSETRELNGLYYPYWGDTGEIVMEFEWEPLMFAISDGQSQVLAAFTPQSYGATYEDAVYTVDGTYRYADGGEERHARLFFRDGRLRQVYGFTGTEGTGAPREIIPNTGDTFTVLEKWMDLDQSGKVEQISTQAGGTLTFGSDMFTWEELDAAVGEYIVGFIVQDLDGNSYESYERITVE